VVVDAGIPPGAAQWDAFHILATLSITELLGEAKINRVESVSLFIEPHQEVVWLDIAGSPSNGCIGYARWPGRGD
jgi:hypothetical protein